MDLKSALAVIQRFASQKVDAAGEHTVRLEPGSICATNRISGCRIPVESVTVTANVPLRDLRQVVGAIPDPVLTLKRSTLHVVGGGSEFKLKCFPAKMLYPYPEEPEADHWSKLEGSSMTSMAALAEVADENALMSPMSALRLTSSWAASATQSMLVVHRVSLGLEEAISVSPQALGGLTGSEEGGAIAVGQDSKLWIKDEATKQVRWAQALSIPWPDSTVDSLLPDTKSAKGRIETRVSLDKLKGLSDRSKILMGGDEYGKLCVDRSKLSIAGSFTRGAFNGVIDIESDDDVDGVGVSPTLLGVILDALATTTIAEGLGDNAQLSFGSNEGGPQPMILIAGGTEALLMPVVLP